MRKSSTEGVFVFMLDAPLPVPSGREKLMTRLLLSLRTNDRNGSDVSNQDDSETVQTISTRPNLATTNKPHCRSQATCDISQLNCFPTYAACAVTKERRSHVVGGMELVNYAPGTVHTVLPGKQKSVYLKANAFELTTL